MQKCLTFRRLHDIILRESENLVKLVCRIRTFVCVSDIASWRAWSFSNIERQLPLEFHLYQSVKHIVNKMESVRIPHVYNSLRLISVIYVCYGSVGIKSTWSEVDLGHFFRWIYIPVWDCRRSTVETSCRILEQLGRQGTITCKYRLENLWFHWLIFRVGTA